MHSLATLRSGGYREASLTRLKLTERLDVFPSEILDNEKYGVANTLEILDLSGTGISELPVDFGLRLPRLKIAFFSNCKFKEFPRVLAKCPCLEMVAFRSNGMTGWAQGQNDGEVSEHCFPFPPRLRWLILTDNKLESIPSSIGRCAQLEKCMLAGNYLAGLPDAMAGCQNLTLLRLAANKLQALPTWVSNMPRLAFLSFAGNVCAGQGDGDLDLEGRMPKHHISPLPHVDWDRIEIHHVLGEGASGIISKGTIRNKTRTHSSAANSDDANQTATADPDSFPSSVAIKIFRGALTSDGTPYDEMAACLAAGQHRNLVRVHGQVRWTMSPDDGDHGEEVDAQSRGKEFKGGLIMELIPPRYRVLGLPPSFETCTRDCFDKDGPDAKILPAKDAISILIGVASAITHMHGRGIMHGDLYAHNILVSKGGDGNNQDEETHAILSDFGAATMYANGTEMAVFDKLEKIEVLAFGYLIEDMLGLMEVPVKEESALSTVRGQLVHLYSRCVVSPVAGRPTFAAIHTELEHIAGLV